jgi:hypothetical protein
MAEAKTVVFSHREIAEMLVRHQGLREGIWGLYVRFALQAANVGISPSDLLPAAIVPVVEIGLQKFEQEGNIAVDAAKVNPVPKHDRRASDKIASKKRR